jgi:hypothetical protein
MATPAFSFNPYIQTSAAGMFTIESDGFVVGTAMPDPATRFALAGGWLATTETVPMFGGIAISELIPTERSTSPATPTRPDIALGSVIARATTLAAGAGTTTGFSVFDQNYAAVNTPTSPVPTIGSGGLVNFYRLGSGARVVLAIDPALVTLEGGLINQQVSWDFSAQRIIAFATNALPVKILQVKSSGCMRPVYTSGTGLTTWNYNDAAALVVL